MNIDINTVVLQILNTLVLFLVLRWLLFKPVTNFLDKRREAITSTINDANQQRDEAEKLRLEYAQKIKEAKQRANETIENAQQQALRQRDEIVDEAKQDAQRIRERAQTEIASQRDQALSYLRNEVADLAIAAAGRVIQGNLDETAQQRLVQEFIDGMDQVNED